MCVCVCVCLCVCVCAPTDVCVLMEVCLDRVLVLCFVMDYVVRSGEIAHKRAHSSSSSLFLLNLCHVVPAGSQAAGDRDDQSQGCAERF